MAVLGKQVIHPAGHEATAELLEWTDVRSGDEVLDVGCWGPDQREQDRP